MEVSGKLHISTTLPPGKDSLYPLGRGVVAGPQSCPGQKLSTLCLELNHFCSCPACSVVTILTGLC
jgi:hypothetical protein